MIKRISEFIIALLVAKLLWAVFEFKVVYYVYNLVWF